MTKEAKKPKGLDLLFDQETSTKELLKNKKIRDLFFAEFKAEAKAKEKNVKIKTSCMPEGAEAVLYEASAEYLQNGDTESDFDVQSLKIRTVNCGDGSYYVIETSRFALDSIDEMVTILKDFENRFTK